MFENSASITSSDIGEEFEARVADILKSLGWEVQSTPRSNDYGADLIAQFGQDKLAIQCKCYAGSHVGRAALMEALYGCKYYGANRAFVIFEGRVSDRLRQEAASMAVGLVNVQDLRPDHELDRSHAKRKREIIKQHEKRRTNELEQDRQRELIRRADVEIVSKFENHDKLVQEAHAAHSRELKEGGASGLFHFAFIVLIGLLYGGFFLFEQFSFLFDREGSTQFDILMTSIVAVLSAIGAILLYAVWLGFSHVEEPIRPSSFEYEAAKSRLGKRSVPIATLDDKSLFEPMIRQPQCKELQPPKSKAFLCSNCDSRLTVSSRHAKRFRCPKCKSIENIPIDVFGP